ncbi:MAG: hemolysin family protein [Ilumatobacteraceae bacterium]
MIAVMLSATDFWMLVAIVLLLALLGFCSVAEMGLSRMTRPKAAALADKGHRSAKVLGKLVTEPERWINPLLLTVFICQIVQSTMTAVVLDNLFGTWGVVVGVFVNVVVFFVLAEAVPKTWAVLHPERAALFAARPTAALVALPPLRWISKGLIWFTNVLVPGKGLQKGPFVSEQELLGYVEAAAQDDVIEVEERELIESVIEFGDTVAREIMVPRPDMVAVPYGVTVTQALDVAIDKGVSRLPVLGEDDEDDVIGLAYTKDLMRLERDGQGGKPVCEVVRAAHVIPENKAVSRLMREMQAQKYHLAFVADEYGSIVGLITLEDCLEELVGDIVDEHDNEKAEVERLTNGDYLISGGMNVGELNDLLALNLPDDHWETIGGFLFGTLEHVPEIGESVEFDGWSFTAHEVEGRRIRMVQVSLIPHREHDGERQADSVEG